uniref:AMP-binding domain-containing protein n=1 Tax=Heterorhabditis bacteriophora TaxID=37862 RepID=A0A1I7WJJ8_HETBA
MINLFSFLAPVHYGSIILYLLYGPLMNGMTSIWFEGVPTHPNPSRLWEVTDKYKGGHMIVPMPGATPMKPGSATYPFFGVNPVILDADGRVIEGPGEGNLCFDRPWPGMLRGVYGDQQRHVSVLIYFFTFFPFYFITASLLFYNYSI